MYTLTATDIHGVITEPTILRNARNDYGKAIRKQYESGEVKAKWSDVKSPEPRTDGISNTLTTVLKDNLLIEPSEEIEQMICQESGLLNPDGIGKTLRIAGGGGHYQRNTTINASSNPDQISRAALRFGESVHNGIAAAQRNGKGVFFGQSPTLLASDHKGPHLVIEEAKGGADDE